jgi:hypothetical protein
VSHRLRNVFVILAVIFSSAAILGTQTPALANHSFQVSGPTICLDGARFTGTATAASALNRTMTGRIFNQAGNTILATGNSNVFTAVGQTFGYVVNYPVGTLTVGQTIRYSASDTATPSGLEGDNKTAVVGNCILKTSGAVLFFDPGDDRLNRQPGVPAVLYCRNKGDVHIYYVDVDTSKGKFGMVVTKAEIDAVIASNPTRNTLIKQSAGGVLKLYYLPATQELSFVTPDLRPPYKPYTFVWKSCS